MSCPNCNGCDRSCEAQDRVADAADMAIVIAAGLLALVVVGITAGYLWARIAA